MKTYEIERVKIKENPKLQRDLHSKAIITSDIEGLQAYRDRRETALRIQENFGEVKALREEINTIKDQLGTVLAILATNKGKV